MDQDVMERIVTSLYESSKDKKEKGNSFSVDVTWYNVRLEALRRRRERADLR